MRSGADAAGGFLRRSMMLLDLGSERAPLRRHTPIGLPAGRVRAVRFGFGVPRGLSAKF